MVTFLGTRFEGLRVNGHPVEPKMALEICGSCAGGDWDARAALVPMGDRAQVADNIDQLLAQVKAVARPGDHLLCMSNGGFGGIHARLLEALKP